MEYYFQKMAHNLLNIQQVNKDKSKNKANERVEEIEMDELYSFVYRKNKIYVITIVSREKRQIVGYDIAFDKDSVK